MCAENQLTPEVVDELRAAFGAPCGPGKVAEAAGLLSYVEILLETLNNEEIPTEADELVKLIMKFIEYGRDLILVASLIHVFTEKQTPKLAKYLDSNNHIDVFSAMLLEAKNNPDGAFHFDGLLSLFAVMARCAPELVSGPKFKVFLAELFDRIRHFDYLDAQTRVSVFDQVFTCVSSPEAKPIMDKITLGDEERNLMQTTMQKVCVNLATVNTVQRIQLLEGLAIAFENAREADDEVLQRWFEAFDEGMVSAIIHYMATVDSAQSMAAMKLTMALLNYDWAYQPFFVNDKFMEFLMDREIRTDKSDAKQLKYDMIDMIVKKDSVHIQGSIKDRLKIYLQQGAYYSTGASSVPQVALESV